jgi:hypothetical protein
MTMSLDRRGGGGYGADLVEERPSELPWLDDDLVGVGEERAGEGLAHNGRILGDSLTRPDGPKIYDGKF